MSDKRSIDAFIWAEKLNLGNTIFKWLNPGEKFVFGAAPDRVMIKAKRGYRDANTNKWFCTGPHTAVFKID